MTATDKLVASSFNLTALRAFSRRHTTAVLCSLFFVLALAIRLYKLGAQSLWLDEGGTWAEITGKRWPALLADLWSEKAAYPLYHVLLKVWVGLAGDSEWALRFPSALAGAGAVVAVYLAAIELRRPPAAAPSPAHPLTRSPAHPLVAAMLVTSSPFALWYAQDAKVYSLLMLIIALELWALLRALRRNDGRAWLIVLIIAVVSLFVHRLALLAAAGAALAYLAVWPTDDGRPTTDDGRPTPAHERSEGTHDRRRPVSAAKGPTTHRPPDRQHATRNTQYARRAIFGVITLVLAVASIVGMVIGVSVDSRGTSGHIPAGPLQGLWLTFIHFSLDRGDIGGYLGLPLIVWALPCLALTLWGLALLLWDARWRDPAAVAILCMFAAPLALLAIALAFTLVYEPRYATVGFPAWVLVLAYPFARPPTAEDRRLRREDRRWTIAGGLSSILSPLSSILSTGLIGALLLINALVLFQPKHGLFSGDPVKEQWRAAITDLAHRVHPDDLIILHPYFVAPLWDYYAPRVTPDPLPQPVTFPVFAGGYCLDRFTDPAAVRACIQREYNEPYFNQQAYGKKRALLLIAPDHANIVDPPLNPERDKYGFVGLRFQYAQQERAWPCGGSGESYIGVEIMCMSFPEMYDAAGPGLAPQPAVQLDATFGGELRLRGYSLDLFGGAARPGGTLPITLYWDALAKPTRDYIMFLHLCRDCAAPPFAQDDGPPLQGPAPAGRTTTWLAGDPIHDERAIILPDNLPPGRYTLLLGVYPAGDPSEGARLPVVSEGKVIGGTRLVLGEVVVTR